MTQEQFEKIKSHEKDWDRYKRTTEAMARFLHVLGQNFRYVGTYKADLDDRRVYVRFIDGENTRMAKLRVVDVLRHCDEPVAGPSLTQRWDIKKILEDYHKVMGAVEKIARKKSGSVSWYFDTHHGPGCFDLTFEDGGRANVSYKEISNELKHD